MNFAELMTMSGGKNCAIWHAGRVPQSRRRRELHVPIGEHSATLMPLRVRVRSKENRGSKNPLERSDQSAILGAALLDAKYKVSIRG